MGFFQRNAITWNFFHRTILYPKLEDKEIVRHCPDVKGMSENFVLFTHNHKGDGGQESASKVNSFGVRARNTAIHRAFPQVKMIVVVYFPVSAEHFHPCFRDDIANEVAAFLSELNSDDHSLTAVISDAKSLFHYGHSRLRLPTDDWAVFVLCGAPQRLWIRHQKTKDLTPPNH
jgi:hypothetical protein